MCLFTFVPAEKHEPVAYTSSFVRYVSLCTPMAPGEVRVDVGSVIAVSLTYCVYVARGVHCAGADMTHTVVSASLTVAVIASGIAVYGG